MPPGKVDGCAGLALRCLLSGNLTIVLYLNRTYAFEYGKRKKEASNARPP